MFLKGILCFILSVDTPKLKSLCRVHSPRSYRLYAAAFLFFGIHPIELSKAFVVGSCFLTNQHSVRPVTVDRIEIFVLNCNTIYRSVILANPN